jgi:hypothetical protein
MRFTLSLTVRITLVVSLLLPRRLLLGKSITKSHPNETQPASLAKKIKVENCPMWRRFLPGD